MAAPEPSVAHARLSASHFLRYWLGMYVATIIIGTVAMLGGLAGGLISGVGTSKGDLAITIGLIAGFVLGLAFGLRAAESVFPPLPKEIGEKRTSALGAGGFFSLIIMLLVGIGVVDSLKTVLPKFLEDLPGSILAITALGGIPSSLCATLFMAYQDKKGR